MIQRQSVKRQRIGPAVRRLRKEQGMTLDALAEASQISPSHLSRLERSQTLPSFPVLAKISDALHVDVNEFVRLERDVERLDQDLYVFLDALAFEPEERTEVLSLSIEARRMLASRLNAIANGWVTPVDAQEGFVTAAQDKSGSEAIRAAGKLITKFGMSGVAFGRAITHLERMPGERMAMISRPSLLLLPMDRNLETVWHENFPEEPIDLSFLRWWSDAGRANLNGSESGNVLRAVVSNAALKGAEGQLLARRLLEYMERRASSEVVLVDDDFGSTNLLIVDSFAAIIEQHPSRRSREAPVKAGALLEGKGNIDVFSAAFNDIWRTATASGSARSRESVVSQLEQAVGSGMQR